MMRSSAVCIIGRLFVFIVFLAALAGCDEARIDATRALNTPPPKSGSLRLLFSKRGLQRLFERSSKGVLSVQVERIAHQSLDSDGALQPHRAFTLGPIATELEPSTWEVESGQERLSVSLRFNRATIPISVRFGQGIDRRLCRFAWQASEWTIGGDFTLDVDTTQAVIQLLRPAELDVQEATVRPLGACPIFETTPSDEPPSSDPALPDFHRYLDEAIRAYVEAALLDAFDRSLVVEPLQESGLPLRSIQISRKSAMPIRRGSILVVGDLEHLSDISLNEAGLNVNLAFAVEAIRAPCAPPSVIPQLEHIPAAPVEASLLDMFSAEVGVAIATSALNRVMAATTLAGLMCRGLEDFQNPARSAMAFAASEIGLEQLGLAHVPTESVIFFATQPGALPHLETQPDSGRLIWTWENMTVDLYGSLYGVPTRILQLNTSFQLSLRLTDAAPGSVGVSLESVDVRQAQIQSEWMSNQPDEEAVLRWTRRLVVLALQDSLSLPIPIGWNAMDLNRPLLVGSQIRENDIVLLLRFPT